MSATGPGQSIELLLDIVAILNAAKIDYAVVGALAASVHGVVRASQDADAIIRGAVSELGELSKKIAAMGFAAELRRGDMDDPIPALLLVSDRYGNRVDMLIGLKGMDSGVYDRAVEVRIPERDLPLRIAGKEDLIAMKVFAGGPQDLLDAKRCIAVAGESLNTSLLRRLVAGYGRETANACEKLLTEAKSDAG